MDHPTTTLSSGAIVLAKPDGTPLTYGNKTQASKKAESLGARPRNDESPILPTDDGKRFYVVTGITDFEITYQTSPLTELERTVAANAIEDLVPGRILTGTLSDDIHEQTARDMFQLAPDAPVTADQRRAAKNINYQSIYGAHTAGEYVAAETIEPGRPVVIDAEGTARQLEWKTVGDGRMRASHIDPEREARQTGIQRIEKMARFMANFATSGDALRESLRSCGKSASTYAALYAYLKSDRPYRRGDKSGRRSFLFGSNGSTTTNPRNRHNHGQGVPHVIEI